MEYDVFIIDNLIIMEISYDKIWLYLLEINMDYFGLFLGVSDNLDLNGL